MRNSPIAASLRRPIELLDQDIMQTRQERSMAKLVPAAPADAAIKRHAIMVTLGSKSIDLVMPTADHQINFVRINVRRQRNRIK